MKKGVEIWAFDGMTLDFSECMCKLCLTTGVKYVWHWPESPSPKNLYREWLSKRPRPLLTTPLSSMSLTCIESPCTKGPCLYWVSLSKKGPQLVIIRYLSSKCPWPVQSGPLQKVPNLYCVCTSPEGPDSNRSLTCTECPFPKGPWLPGPQRPSVTPPSPSIGVSELSARKQKNTELTSPLFLRCKRRMTDIFLCQNIETHW